MKLSSFVTLAGLVQAGLAFAIPLGHQKLHAERRDASAIATETVTTIFYQTVIWVDQSGNTVSTEINTPPPDVATSTPPPSLTSPTLSLSTPIHAESASIADLGAGKRPIQTSQASQTTSELSSESSILPSSTSKASSQSSNVGNTKVASTAPGGMGICYDMIDAQTLCKQSSTINQEFQFLQSQGYGMVRVYDVGCPVGDFVAAAAQNGLKIMVGINAISNLQGDLSKLIGMVNGNWGPVDTVYIGNELVNSGIAHASDVAGAVSVAKGILSGAGFSGSVVTVDTFNVMQNDPTICSTSDYCAVNTHAFFDPNTAANGAGPFVINAYNSVAQANGGKKVVITESGWPWQGSCNGQACPSVDNQKTAMNSIMESFSGMPENIFIFQAYDAIYKPPGSFGAEQFWGIYDSDHYVGGIGPS